MANLSRQSIDALANNATANNNIADINRNYTAEITALRRAMDNMVTEGSQPLRTAIASLDEIKLNVRKLHTDRDNDRLLQIRIQSTLESVQLLLTNFQIRATNEMNRIVIPEVKPSESGASS